MNDLNFCSATELAQIIRNRAASAVKVTEAFLKQIALHNSKLNAIVWLDEERVRQRAKEADEALARGEIWGPLHGVPVTIKDTYETAGMRTTSGYEKLRDYVPRQDATIVARLRAAGAIILGKTNMPALARDMQTNGTLLGRANNPWNTSCTTGGSSGGEAAAIAAGLSPLGLGSDLAGSLRFPAHCCGILALNPTIHRVSGAGSIPPMPGAPRTAGYLVAHGSLARSVADLRLCLSLIAGPDERDPNIPPVPLVDTPKRPLSQYRLAWMDDFDRAPISEDTKLALTRLANDLAKAGCQIERKNPPDFDFQLAWKTFGELTGFTIGPPMPLVQRIGFRLLGRWMFKDPLMSAAARVANLDACDYLKALANRNVLIAALACFRQANCNKP